MIEILSFSAIICISYGIGKSVLNIFRKDATSLLEDFVFATGLGLGMVGYAVYILGSLGFLYWYYILAMLLVCCILAFHPIVKFLSRIKLTDIKLSISGLSLFDKMLAVVVITIPIVCLVGVFAPEIGNDALAYHLYHPKVFIENHKIGYIPFSRESLWPYLTQMLFTIGLLFKSVTVAKMFHYFFGILSALSVFAFTRRFFGKKEALLASALFYSAPGIFMQSVYSYVDLSLCFYSFASLYLVMLWNENKNVKTLILAGIFTGLSLSVKLLGVFTFIPLCAIILFISFNSRTSFSSMIKSLLIFCGVVFLVSSVWYIRSYFVLKNPVYPFLDKIFTSGWDDKLGEAMGVRRDLTGLLRLPWDLAMNVNRFGNEQIGVVFLVLLPCLSFLNFKESRVKMPLTFLLLYTITWFVVDQNIRFAFAGMAVVYILLSVGFCAALHKYGLSGAKILVSLCVMFNLSLCFYYNRNSIKFAMGSINKKEYLTNYERTYPITEFINNNTKPGSIVISVGEPRLFYFNRKTFDYYMWSKDPKEAILNYVERVKKNNDVFLLMRDDAEPYKEIQRLIKDKPVIFRLPREVDEGKTAQYLIYVL